MTLKTWKNEFYPTDAKDFSGEAPGLTEQDAVRHALRKWEGLTPENLAKHKVSLTGFGRLTDGTESMSIDYASCSLCRMHKGGDDCVNCVLAQVREGDDEPAPVDCDSRRNDEDLSPYRYFLDHNDPQPMIMWLRKAEERAVHESQIGQLEQDKGLDMEDFVGIAVNPVKDDGCGGLEACEPGDPGIAHWSVYLQRRPELAAKHGLSLCIADCPDSATAEIVAGAVAFAHDLQREAS